ncbi:hypothetical protein PCE1_001016 [Barthelona sp. PCE]
MATIVETMTAEQFRTAIDSEQFQKFKVTNEMTRHDAAIIAAGDKHTIQSLVTEEVRNIYFSSCLRAVFSSVFNGEVMTDVVGKLGIAKVFEYYKKNCSFVDETEEILVEGAVYEAQVMATNLGALLNTQSGQTMEYREPSEQDLVTMLTIQNMTATVVNSSNGNHTVYLQPMLKEPKYPRGDMNLLNNNFGLVSTDTYEVLMDEYFGENEYRGEFSSAEKVISKLHTEQKLVMDSGHRERLAIVAGKMSTFQLCQWFIEQVVEGKIDSDKWQQLFHLFAGIGGVIKDKNDTTLDVTLRNLGFETGLFTLENKYEQKPRQRRRFNGNSSVKNKQRGSYKKKNDTNKNRKGSVVDDESHSGNLSIQCGQLCEHIEQLTKAINESTAVKKHEIAQPVLPPDFSVEVGYVTDTRYELHAGKYVRRVFKS